MDPAAKTAIESWRNGAPDARTMARLDQLVSDYGLPLWGEYGNAETLASVQAEAREYVLARLPWLIAR